MSRQASRVSRQASRVSRQASRVSRLLSTDVTDDQYFSASDHSDEDISDWVAETRLVHALISTDPLTRYTYDVLVHSWFICTYTVRLLVVKMHLHGTRALITVFDVEVLVLQSH